MNTEKVILVVEDNEINRLTLCGLLSATYQTLEAEHGRQALDILAERAEDISLILLDIMMPEMDGYTFLSVMRENPAYSSIPVIVTTQSECEADEVEALSHGATDFVVKPYKPEVILHRVASIIRLRETAAMVNQLQYDQLTGLYSKTFFYQRVRELLQQNPDQEFDIVCSDIDNFKLINDVFGVSMGDRLLQDVANQYDRAVGDKGICGRINADRFGCLIQHRTDYRDEMFIQATGQINTLDKVQSVVMKWGIYTVEDRGVSVEQMCDRALLAARSIKGQYGKYFATYDDTLRSRLLREQSIIDNMESALAQGQFQVYLQPKYQIQDGLLAGAEALVRWIHPEWGIQSPGEFIPLFEKNGFITRLDQFVWEQTCVFLRKWEDAGLPSVPVSVNVSRADIYHANIADILLDIVGKYGLEPARLHLEITESAYTEDPNQIIETVSQLRTLGFIIEMDDFGSGYSSLNMLNQMPIDVLKLDMRFIQSETAKPLEQGILRFIMDLARWMELTVVAEGVETREQLERLAEIGCDYAQGYYFARPMLASDFEALLRQEGAASLPDPRTALPGHRRQRQLLLVADEDAAYRDQVSRTFQDLFQVIEAGNAQEALDAIREHKGRLVAVLLSAALPEPDGFTVLDTIKRDRTVWNIPIIMTGAPDAQMEEKALDLGAEEYIDKPHTQKSLWKQTLRAMGTSTSREWERALEEEAYRDYQTGLLNRRGFYAAVDSLKEKDLPLAVYIFDLDNLKLVNDTYGHGAGDRFIEGFSNVLLAHTRESDIIARFGGDEFVVVMKQMRTQEAALKKGEEICVSFRKKACGGEIVPSCTAGICHCQSKELIAEMIARADQALYSEKAGSKGTCRLWRG